MVQKEDDTLILLTPVEEDSLKEGSVRTKNTRRSYVVSGISSSFLCGAGIFISNIVLLCRGEGSCKESEIFRVTSMLGGIISSLIVGRAVDFYGRQSSLMFSVLFWLFASVFILFLPSQTQQNVNYYDAPLSEYYFWPSESRYSSEDYPLSFTVSAYNTKVPLPYSFSYSYLHNSSVEDDIIPTQPAVLKSVSIQSYGTPISAAPAEIDNHSDKFLVSKNEMLKFSGLKAVNTMMNSEKHSVLIPLLTFHLFLGAASAASIVTVSVYIFETSSINSQACWLSLSDLFSSLFVLFLPVIQGHLILLSISTWLPMIVLALLQVIPLPMPDYLSLPRSPHFLLLSLFMQRRNSMMSKSEALISNVGKEVAPGNTEAEGKQFNVSFKSYANLGYLKIPFKKAKIKIYHSSTNSSPRENAESSWLFNENLKHVVLETNCEHFQPITEENDAGSTSISDQQSEMDFSVESCDHSTANIVGNLNTGEKCIEWETKRLGELGESFNLNKNVIEEYDDEGSGTVFSESKDTCHALDFQEESTTLIQDANILAQSWQEKESLRILSFLNGKIEGFVEWRRINDMLMEDINGMKYPSKNKFFHYDTHSIFSTLQLVFKVGLPLIIIHMFSCDYGAVVILSETVFPKLGFCNVSGPALITSLQVMSSGTSVLVLDKLKNQMVFNSAAVIMTSSLIILWFLIPSIQAPNDGELLSYSRSSPTPNPMLPTLYPFLPTPLPQVLKGRDHLCLGDQFESIPSHAWNHVESVFDGKKPVSSNSPSIWLPAFILVIYVVTSSLILLPLARLMLVSYFPIHKRGTCVGVSFSIEWILRLVMIFFPRSFIDSYVGFILCIGALLLCILYLCMTSFNMSSKDKIFLSEIRHKNVSHPSSYRKICNMSEMNSTAV
ncbi:uncharacterized protein LOC124160034 [Ischnura elegans]|uniref:uncharacterized protein LOC124160034 n=1 Tax=Ischnura elegans TaxID=197161 RepID=UPI001ED88434|nr:uncharacterized protein LOC124160034 [Ischnura elegans]